MNFHAEFINILKQKGLTRQLARQVARKKHKAIQNIQNKIDSGEINSYTDLEQNTDISRLFYDNLKQEEDNNLEQKMKAASKKLDSASVPTQSRIALDKYGRIMNNGLPIS